MPLGLTDLRGPKEKDRNVESKILPPWVTPAMALDLLSLKRVRFIARCNVTADQLTLEMESAMLDEFDTASKSYKVTKTFEVEKKAYRFQRVQ
jgi:hypothetical protein